MPPVPWKSGPSSSKGGFGIPNARPQGQYTIASQQKLPAGLAGASTTPGVSTIVNPTFHGGTQFGGNPVAPTPDTSGTSWDTGGAPTFGSQQWYAAGGSAGDASLALFGSAGGSQQVLTGQDTYSNTAGAGGGYGAGIDGPMAMQTSFNGAPIVAIGLLLVVVLFILE